MREVLAPMLRFKVSGLKGLGFRVSGLGFHGLRV